MRIREYQLKELQRARELQKELCELHVPSPVLSWKYEIIDADGQIEEKGIGKANSYTRNGLNYLTWVAGCAPKANAGTTFGDNVMSYKSTAAAITSAAYGTYGPHRNYQNDVTLILGTSTDAESLESYAMTDAGMTANSDTTVWSSFDATSRIMSTTVSRVYTNNGASAVNVTEAGITMYMRYGSSLFFDMLIVRDKFDSIPVAAGASIAWSYTFETSYPS